MKKEFNLLHEPWIRVMSEGVELKETSVLELFKNAHEYSCLAGEIPAQDMAIMRVLLAILTTVVYRCDENGDENPVEDEGDVLRRWMAIKKAGRFPADVIETYLKKYEDRFWLFHPETPFWQSYTGANGTEYNVSKLNGCILESGNKPRLFMYTDGVGKSQMSYAEAARWLVYTNAYDDVSVKKSKAFNQSGRKDNGSPGTGWLGKLGLIAVNGKNLFDTLMLNLVLLDRSGGLFPDPKPIWEVPVRTTERNLIALPDNLPELYTIQSRLILLDRDEEKGVVTGYHSVSGDFFEAENATIEPMTIWRMDDKKKVSPKLHSPEAKMWQEFSTCFVNNSDVTPGIVQWLGLLTKNRLIDKKQLITFQSAGSVYDSKRQSTTDFLSDTLSVNAGFVEDMDSAWFAVINTEIEKCLSCADVIWRLSNDLIDAEGGNSSRSKKAKFDKEAFFFAIDEPFRQWIANISPSESDVDEEVNAWRSEIKRIAREQANRMVKGASLRALVGKQIDRDEGTGNKKKHVCYHMSSPEAEKKFYIQLSKIYPKNKEEKTENV